MERQPFRKPLEVDTTRNLARAIPASPRAHLAQAGLEAVRWMWPLLQRVFWSRSEPDSTKEPAASLKRPASLFLLLFLLSVGLCAAAERNQQIPFRLLDGYLILVRGDIGELQGLNLLVDTGANPSSIDDRVATKLGLAGRREQLPLFQGQAEVRRALLPDIHVGPIRCYGLTGLVQDLSPLERKLKIRIDAIIGLDVLGGSSFTIDYERRKIEFGYVENSTTATLTGPERRTASIDVTVGNETVSLLVDTGAADLVLFDCKLGGQLSGQKVIRTKQSLNSQLKPFDAREVLIPQILVGSFELGTNHALLLDDSRLCGLAFSGVVGPSSLRMKRVSFDFDRQIVAWSR
jgi:hypothetical protein